jgi:hypothetical protein
MQLSRFLRLSLAAGICVATFAAPAVRASPLDVLRGTPRVPDESDLQPFASPVEFHSENGALFVSMEARATPVKLGRD